MNEADPVQSRSEKEIFFEALDKNTPQERAAFLDGACGKNPAFRARVEALLADHFHEDAFMKKPAAAREEPVKTIKLGAVVNPNDEAVGQTIGRYKLLEKVGEGGCGAVYVAQQNEPVRRRVALKVIKLGMDTKEVIARFEAERQALAMMDHPNIAKVFDAGTTDTGRPYFVMELVRGIKITDYCDQNQLNTKERLTLLIEVCHAVQHAHQKGIIHRDLKPSNIMVTLHDGVPVPKVIDFGIAKATEGRLTAETVYTQLHQFIGTPAYMSPEQAEMSGLDIDTRSDIYSLGVLLYELLAGSTPFDAKELMASGLDAMRKIIREQEPVRPSTRFATLHGADLTTTAKRRSTDTTKLLHQIKGDLDWIVMKCLEKDRARRYETANGLAMDIQRHLQNELVVARPPSLGYKFQKLVRRNKLAFAAVGAVIAALIIGLAVSTWMFFKEQQARKQAEAERQIAKTEAAKATAISDFLQQSLQSANPDDIKGSDYTVRQQLDDFSEGLKNQFQDQPEVEAQVRETIGKAYYRLGVGDKAQEQLERVLLLNRRFYGEHKEVAATLVDCAWASFEQGQFTNAESQANVALDIYRKDGAVGQPVLFAFWASQAIVHAQDRYTDAEIIGDQALKLASQTPNNEYPETASILHIMAECLNGQSKYAEAESYARRAVEMHRRLQGSLHPETGWALLALGTALAGQNKLEEAELTYREALSIFRGQYFSGHKSVDEATSYLMDVLKAEDKPLEIEALYNQELADQRSALGTNSPVVAATLIDLAGFLKSKNRLEDAAQRYQEWAGIILKPGWKEHLMEIPSAVVTQLVKAGYKQQATNICGAMLRSEVTNALWFSEVSWFFATTDNPLDRDSALAVELSNRAVLVTNRKEPIFLDALAAAHAANGQFTNALVVEHEAIALQQNQEQKTAFGLRLRLYQSNIPYLDHGVLALDTSALLVLGKFAEAEPLARECLELRQIIIPDDWRTFNARSMLGGCLLGQKKYAEAEPLLLSGYEGLKQREDKIPPGGSIRPQQALQRLVQLYDETGRPELAARWSNELSAWTNKTSLQR